MDSTRFITTISSGHSSMALVEKACVLEEVRRVAEMSAACGMCCEDGKDSIEGIEAADEVERLRGVMESKEEGLED